MRKLITKIIHIFMPKFIQKYVTTCEHHSIDMANWSDLTFLQRLKLKVHLFMCYKCFRYFEQLKLIKKTVKKNCDSCLPNQDDLKKEIIDKHSKSE